MNQVTKVLFIVNKFAGGGYKPEIEGRIIETCARENVEAIIEFTKGPQHAITLARQATRLGVQRVVAVGGDGTLNEVAQGLHLSKVAMGIIPRGSGNGLARHLCIPLSVQGALDSFFSGTEIAIDTFTLNNKLSLNVSGIGFDGHIANLFGGKTKRGLTGYAKLTLKEFLRFTEFKSTLTINGVEIERQAFVIAIANSSQYGNNACIAPSASVSDGILHLTLLKKIPAYRLDFVYDFFARRIEGSRYSEIMEVKNIKITTPLPVAYHVDGEPCGTDTSFDIVIHPAALQLIVPVRSGRR